MGWRLWLVSLGLVALGLGTYLLRKKVRPAAARKYLHLVIGPGYLVSISGSPLAAEGAGTGARMATVAIPATAGLLYFALPVLNPRGLGRRVARGDSWGHRHGVFEYGVIFTLVGALLLGVGAGAARERGLGALYVTATRATVAASLCLAGGDGLAGLASLLPARRRTRLYGAGRGQGVDKTIQGSALCFLGSALSLVTLYALCERLSGEAMRLGCEDRGWGPRPLWGRALAIAFVSAVVEGLPLWGSHDNAAVFCVCAATWAAWDALCLTQGAGGALVPLAGLDRLRGPGFWVALWAVVVLAAFTGYRGSFTPGGALAGLAVSMAHLCAGWAGFWALMAFVILGLVATRFRRERKARIVNDGKEENGREGAGKKDAAAPEKCPKRKMRKGPQILATSLPQALLCVLAAFSPDPALHRTLESAAVVGYAASLADTFSSEIGMAFPGRVFSLIPPEEVPAGYNGGMSLVGTLASGIGGFSVGMVYALCQWAQETPAGFQEIGSWARTVAEVTVYGVIGMLIDAVLGSTLQFSGKDASGRVTSDPREAKGNGTWRRRDILTNSQVNLASVVLTMLLYLGRNVHSGRLQRL